MGGAVPRGTTKLAAKRQCIEVSELRLNALYKYLGDSERRQKEEEEEEEEEGT